MIFYQEMASEHRLQENGKVPVPLYISLFLYLFNSSVYL